MNPRARTLLLASPHLRGRDVAEVQRLLGVADDGEFGPVTAAAVVAWKQSRGLAPSNELGPAAQKTLRADVPLRAVSAMEEWAEDGLREVPPGSNRVSALIALAGRLGVAPAFRAMGFPWCAFAAFLAALTAGGTTAERGLCRREFEALYTPAILASARAGEYGLTLIPSRLAFRGDLVLFDWNFAAGDPADHVARLVRAPADGRVRTVDGNTGDEGMALRDRSLRSVRAFARDS